MRSAQCTAHDALKIFWINKSSQPSKDPDKEKETLKRIIIKKSLSDTDDGKCRRKELPKYSINAPDTRHMVVI